MDLLFGGFSFTAIVAANNDQRENIKTKFLIIWSHFWGLSFSVIFFLSFFFHVELRCGYMISFRRRNSAKIGTRSSSSFSLSLSLSPAPLPAIKNRKKNKINSRHMDSRLSWGYVIYHVEKERERERQRKRMKRKTKPKTKLLHSFSVCVLLLQPNNSGSKSS
jgi:hypothetical protein